MKHYKVKSPDDAVFAAARELLVRHGVSISVVSGSRHLLAGPDMPAEVAAELSLLGATVSDDRQYSPEELP